MSFYTEKERLRLIRDAHVVHPGVPGMQCEVMAGEDAMLTVIDGWVACPACGNELGRADQLMLTVWNDKRFRSRQHGTARLEFVG